MIKWIMSTALGKFLFLGLGALLGAYFKGRFDQTNRSDVKAAEKEVERLKRLNEVEDTTTRADALKRLRRSGDVRRD